MARIGFEDIRFADHGNVVRAFFLKQFYFEIPLKDLLNIGPYTIENGELVFESSQEIAKRKFERILLRGMNELKNIKNDKPTVYVHKFSGIPLIGSNAFGLVDRDTNIIEIKPITTCNLKCIYCSVNEDRRFTDFIVEKDYLVQEFTKLSVLKRSNSLEAHIGGQGEPMLYKDLIPLIGGLSSIDKVKIISIDTNVTLLTRERVDALIAAGLTRFNFSLNAMTDSLCEGIADSPYNLDHVLDIIRYASEKANVILAPVLVPGKNEDEMQKIIDFAKTLQKKPLIGIQNYLYYKGGRNPGKSWGMDHFMEFLRSLEKKTHYQLILSAGDFLIEKDKVLEAPFKKLDVVHGEIFCNGRMPGEKIAVSENRVVTINRSQKEKGFVKIRINKAKHNIFYGDIVK
jgi:uncharacterized protein